MDDPLLLAGLLITFAVIVVIVLLLLLMFRSGSRGKSIRKSNGPKTVSPIDPPNRDAFRPCPICSTMLKRGERVKSAVFQGKPDSIAHIFGCPYCYPPSPETPRICPVCKQVVADDGYVVARMFEGKGKTHVHVLGCTGCRRVR